MAKQLQLRKGTATEHNTFTGANGEVTVDTTNKTLRVHDGSTVGGTMLATSTGGLVPSAQLPAATTSTQGVVILNNTLTSTNTNQALTAAQGKVLNDQAFGVGQSWQDVTASRALGTTYTNSTGKPIEVSISLPDTGGQSPTVTIDVGGVGILINNYDLGTGVSSFSHSFVVPVGATYRISVNISVSITTWAELR